VSNAFSWDSVRALIEANPSGLTNKRIAELTGWDYIDVRSMTFLLAKYGAVARIPSAARAGQPIVYIPLNHGPAG
jgi:hypothetical protein